jgi:ABC-type glycerol-3-phosphate transport system permease component
MLLVPWVIPPAMSTLGLAVAVRSLLQAHSTIRSPFRHRADPMDRRCDVGALLGNPRQHLGWRAVLHDHVSGGVEIGAGQLYEAAAIDGANWWQRIWYVTLPMMRNIIAITTLFSLIVTFANFDIVRILTAGGPLDHTHIFATWAFRSESRAATYRWAPASRCSWCRSLRSQRSSSCGTSTSAGTKPDEHRHDRQGRADPQGQVRQHEPRPRLGAEMVVLLLTIFAMFSLLPPLYMLITSLKSSAEISAATNPWWVFQPDACELRRNSDVEPVPAVLLELGDGLDLCRNHHHADQRSGRLRAGADAVLGFGDARHRRFPDLLDPRDAAVHPLFKMFAVIGDWTGIQLINRWYVLLIIYPTLTVPFCTWIMIGYFASIPKELDEAAVIDGASWIQTLTRIFIPVAFPASLPRPSSPSRSHGRSSSIRWCSRHRPISSSCRLASSRR